MRPTVSQLQTGVAGFTPAQQRIHSSMLALLARSDLEYCGAFADAGPHRVHYLDYGSGPPVFLIHGGGAGCAIWYRQIAALSPSFRVIAPDNPMFGLSSQTYVNGSMRQFTAGYLLSLMDCLGIERASFVGLSLGGYASLSVALAAPERVDKLCLINSAGLGAHLPWVFRLITLPVIGHLLSRPNKWAQDRFFETVEVVNGNGPDSEAFKRYAYDVTTSDRHGLAVRRNMPRFANLRGQLDIYSDSELASVRQPALIVWGERDAFFPVGHGHRAHSLITGSRLEVLPESGHVAIWDRPADVSRLLLEFLSG